MACGFPGNQDVYGIGIRIGYYTQALAVWFSNYFFFREAKVLRAANNLFLFALVVVGFIYTYHAQTTFVIEAFLLLQIGLCIAFVSIMESTRFSSRYMRKSGQRLALRTVIINAGLLFNICFWWRGLDVMLPTPCDGNESADNSKNSHSTYACYAFRADIYGWMRTLMKVLSLASLVWTTQTVTARDAAETIQRLRMKQARTEFIKFNPDVGAVKSKDLKSAVKSTQDYKKLCHDKAIRILPGELPPGNPSPEELQPPESVRLPLPPSGLTTPTKQTVPSKMEKDSKLPEKGLSRNSVISYAGVRDAELYIDSIFSIYTRKTALSLDKKRFLCLCKGRKPQTRYQYNLHSATYLDCAWTTMKSTWINKPRMDMRWRLALHMVALGQHPPWRWPRFLHRMYQLNEKRQPPHWHLLVLASDAQLSQIPLTITPKVWTLMAMENLAIVVVLIVQVELTIAWNHISGLQNLNTLGQLIPFILGVGGLLKVLWGKWCMVSKGIKETPSQDERYLGEYEAAIGRYLKWKEEVEKEVIVTASRQERAGASA